MLRGNSTSNIPIDVLVFFAALAVGFVLLAKGYFAHAKSSNKTPHRAFVLYTTGLTIILNARYFTDGTAKSIAFFVGVKVKYN